MVDVKKNIKFGVQTPGYFFFKFWNKAIKGDGENEKSLNNAGICYGWSGILCIASIPCLSISDNANRSRGN